MNKVTQICTDIVESFMDVVFTGVEKCISAIATYIAGHTDILTVNEMEKVLFVTLLLFVSYTFYLNVISFSRRIKHHTKQSFLSYKKMKLPLNGMKSSISNSISSHVTPINQIQKKKLNSTGINAVKPTK